MAVQGKLDDAILLCKQAVAIWEMTGGTLLANGLSNLAGVMRAQVCMRASGGAQIAPLSARCGMIELWVHPIEVLLAWDCVG